MLSRQVKVAAPRGRRGRRVRRLGARERPQHATAAAAMTIDLADAVRRGGHALYAQGVPTLDKRVRQPYRTVVALAKAIP